MSEPKQDVLDVHEKINYGGALSTLVTVFFSGVSLQLPTVFSFRSVNTILTSTSFNPSWLTLPFTLPIILVR